MKRITYISSVLLLACAAFISCERDDVRRPEDVGAGRPIEFIVESEWPEITKASLYDIDDIRSDGFKIWGIWHRDPNDRSNYVHDDVVFGTIGTIVAPQGKDGAMVPENEAVWHRGYYNFAAVFPSSLFSGSHTSSFQQSTANDKVTNNYVSVLALEFGDEGFNLGNEQQDLMCAFGNADNSNNDGSVVSLNFRHLFSRVTVKLTYTSIIPEVEDVTIYGIHRTIYGKLRYRHEIKDDDTPQITVSDNMSDLLQSADLSTEQEPYEYCTTFNYDETGTVTLIEDMLVFPETLSPQCALSIKIRCHLNDIEKEIYTEVSSGTWEPGGTYTYILNADSITM